MSKKKVLFKQESDLENVYRYEQVSPPPEEKKSIEQSEERKAWFTDFMGVSLGLRIREKRLEEVSLEAVAKYIRDGKCRNIVTMGGAGMSTGAGIPDYRSPDSGVFEAMKKKYPHIVNVTDLFNIQFFLREPAPFFERSKRFFEICLKPTPAHYFVRLLHEKGVLLRHFTQNIDTLDRLAGLPEEQLVEAHGSFQTGHCMLCDHLYTFQEIQDQVLAGKIPRCQLEDCEGVIKPDIVMYGESLEDRFENLSDEDTVKCDLLIVMGTALAVQPFSCMTAKVFPAVPRLYINMDRGKTSKKHPMSEMMFGASFDFDSDSNYRDVYYQGRCDDACFKMADILGWKEELENIVQKEHGKIDEENKTRGLIDPSLISTANGESRPKTRSKLPLSAAEKRTLTKSNSSKSAPKSRQSVEVKSQSQTSQNKSDCLPQNEHNKLKNSHSLTNKSGGNKSGKTISVIKSKIPLTVHKKSQRTSLGNKT